MSLLVKICGITRELDAEDAARAGADFIGLNFWPASRRHVAPARARVLADCARARRPDIQVVGVFVDADADEIEQTIATVGLDRVQLHGSEPATLCERLGDRAIKALALGSERDLLRFAVYDCPLFLVDTPTAGHGGSGVVGDWVLARRAAQDGRRFLLAGGLTPGNVAAAVSWVGPAGVDVASGVEVRPGEKDADLMRHFVSAARAAAARAAEQGAS